MKFSIVLFTCLVGFAIAQEDNTANVFVDQIITSLKAKKGFDPLLVPDQHKAFDQKLGLIDIKGSLDLTHIKITGLSNIHREGDAKLENKDGAFSASLRLGDSNIKVHADIKVNLGKILHPKLQLDMDIGNIGLKFSVTIGSDGKPAIGNFEVDDLEKVHFHVHGLGPLDPLVDFIGDEFVVIANKEARKLVTGIVKPVIEDQLKNMN